MIQVRNCVLNKSIEGYPMIEMNYDVHLNKAGFNEKLTINEINREVCKELLFSAFEITYEELKDAFPEKFI